MAKNWKAGEALRAVMAGNKEDILDIGRRFPLFLNLASQTNEAGAKLLDCVPDYCTARKIEAVLKGDAVTSEGGEDDDGEPGTDEKEATKPAKEAPAKEAKKDAYAGKTAKELFTLCKERKIEVEPKQPAEIYIKALKKADVAKAKKEEKPETKPAADDDWDDDEKPATPAKKEEKKETKKKDEDDDWDI